MGVCLLIHVLPTLLGLILKEISQEKQVIRGSNVTHGGNTPKTPLASIYFLKLLIRHWLEKQLSCNCNWKGDYHTTDVTTRAVTHLIVKTIFGALFGRIFFLKSTPKFVLKFVWEVLH